MALNVSATKPQPYVPSSAMGKSTATDGSGNVYVTGLFGGSSITFGSITLTNHSNSGYCDMFIVKYDPSGNVLWAQSAGGNLTDGGGSITTDDNGNVYVLGEFLSSSITFGGYTFTDAGKGDMFIVKYDPNGTLIWATNISGNSFDSPGGIVTDGENVYATGYYLSPFITFFGTTQGTTTLAGTGSYDMFIVKYDLNGNVLWAESAGGIGDAWGTGITKDGNGNVYVTGDFKSSSITFGNYKLNNMGISLPTQQSFDIFIVKYNASGTVLWATSAGGTADDFGHGIATDNSGNVFVTGYFDSPTITFFGTTPGTINLIDASAGYPDMFIVKYDPTGKVLWANRAGGSLSEQGYSIATDGSGNVYVSGQFSSFHHHFWNNDCFKK